MATITGLTAAAMIAIRDGAVTDAHIDVDGHLILVRYDGTEIDTGSLATAIPDASTDAAGIIELATATETAALSDAGRAVTPSGLASALKAKIVSGIAESADQTAYPSGISMMSLASGSGWSLNGGLGAVVTTNSGTDRVQQIFYSNSGGTSSPRAWMRLYNSTSGGGGWTAWQQYMVMNALDPTAFSQTTAFTVYPQGQSRLYYTTANSSGWDFAGKNGEVITYRDGTDFARQTWTEHVGGTTGSIANTETWVRTANAANGWTKWLIVAEDTGWIGMTLAGGYTLKQSCGVRRKNGVVYLKGAFTAPSGGYSTALTLPTGLGLAPAEDKTLPVTTNSAVSMSAMVTAATGTIGTWTSGVTTAWFSLGGLSWPVG